MQQPQPDGKDWTWAGTQACPDCGFDPAHITHEDVPELTVDYAQLLADAVRAPGAADRPAPQVWSPLEYGCHVRDVCAIFTARLGRMIAEDDPLFANWDQDAAALEDRYWEQRPGPVAGQLIATAAVVAGAFADVAPEQWQRPGRRSNGSVFTVSTLARYFLHDLAHHVDDVQRGVRSRLAKGDGPGRTLP